MIGVDLDAQKLSLGLKPSYFEGEDSEGDADQTVKDVDEEAFEAAAELDSSNEDMELGEYNSKRPVVHGDVGASSECFTRRPYSSTACSPVRVLCHPERNTSSCSLIVSVRTKQCDDPKHCQLGSGMRMDDTEQDAAQHIGLRHQENGDDDEDDNEDEENTADSDDAGEAEEKGALSASTAAGACHLPGRAILALQPWQTQGLI